MTQLDSGTEGGKRGITSAVGAQNWKFYAVPTSMIDELFGQQKEVRLSVLETSLHQHGYIAATYEELKSAVDKCIDTILGFHNRASSDMA